MSEQTVTVGELADDVRSKNAGPFWITFDIFLATNADYEALIGSETITAQTIGRLYQVEPAMVQIFPIEALRVIKISFPRAVPAGSFHDRDQHAGQQHVPLARLPLALTGEASAALGKCRP